MDGLVFIYNIAKTHAVDCCSQFPNNSQQINELGCCFSNSHHQAHIFKVRVRSQPLPYFIYIPFSWFASTKESSLPVPSFFKGKLLNFREITTSGHWIFWVPSSPSKDDEVWLPQLATYHLGTSSRLYLGFF